MEQDKEIVVKVIVAATELMLSLMLYTMNFGWLGA